MRLGAAHLLVLLGTVRLTDASGAGASLHFDGRDDYASVFPGFQLLDDWTIEFWVKPTSLATVGQCVLSLQTFGGDNLLTFTSRPVAAWQVLYGPDGQGIPEDTWTSTGFDGLYQAANTHVALTHQVFPDLSMSELSLYFNSVLRAAWNVSTTAAAQIVQQQQVLPVTLGACYEDTEAANEEFGRGIFRTKFFDGHMDEVRWWSVVRTETGVAETWVFSGDPLYWPVPATTVPTSPTSGKTVDTTDTLVVAQANAIRAKYSFDQTENNLIDGSGNALHGWRGSGPNSLDQPDYETSVFSELRLGAAYRVLRAPLATTINFEQIILGHFLLNAQSYNSLLVIDGLTDTSVGTTVRGASQAVGSPFTPGTLIGGLSVIVTTGVNSIPDTFSVQPCRGASFQTPAVSQCQGERVYPVTFSVVPRTAPYAGPGYALQLLQGGGFVQLPRPSTPTFTLEFNLRLTKPFKRGTSILSIQRQASSTAHDPLHLWLDSARGGAVLEICTASGASSQVEFIPEIGTLDAQHIAITFSYQSGQYTINVFKDCVLVGTVTVPNSCYAFNDNFLREPTLGQRYRDDEQGAAGAPHPWSTNFCAMYVSEMRMWSNVRTTQAICSAMVTRLAGTEAGLYMYAPVLAEDSAKAATEEALAVARRNGALLEVKQVTTGGAFPLQTGIVIVPNASVPQAQVMCSADVGVCPNAGSGVGWTIRLGIFANTPPEETLLETTTTVNLQASFLAADVDNLVDNLLAPISTDATVWDIVDFPDPVCLLLFENGVNQFIPTPLTDPTRATFGLPVTERITDANLPLLMEPFGGALLAQITEANGSCSTSFTYRAVDTGSGQVSPHLALVRFNVWRPGPLLLNVTAAEVGVGDDGLDGGDVLLFYFDLPSETAFEDPREIFDVQDGSWGTSTPVGSWVESSTVFVVTVGGGLRAGGASFTPGATRFQVKRSAVVRRVGDPLSKPCTTLSSPLAGSFNTAICAVGHRFSAANGTCLPCPAGTYWTTTGNGRGVQAVACEPCEAGQFGNSTALTACFDCERGYYMPATATDRTSCLEAPPGTFVAEVGEDIATPCPLDAVQETPAQLSCYACPTNASCNGGATPQGPVAAGTMAIPVAGHFRFSATRFPTCAVPSACYSGGFCKEGHQSPELGCYECRPSWHRWESMLRHRSECFECPSEGLGYLAFAAVVFCSLLLALPLAALGFSIAFRSECMHLFMIKILLNHLAMMHIFTTFEIWEMRDGFGDTADALRHIFTALFTWDGSVPVYAVPLRCLLEDRMEDYSAKDRLWAELLLWTLLPIIFPLFCAALGLVYAEGYVLIATCTRRMRKPQTVDNLSGVVPAARAGSAELQRGSTQTSVESGVSRHSGISRASTSSTVSGNWDVSTDEERLLGIWRKSPAGMPWQKRWSRFGEDTFAICVATSMLIYAPTVRQLLTFLQCGPITGDPLHDQRMLAAPQYSCDDDDYNSLAMLAWPALLVWGVGLPLTAALMLWNLQSSWAAFSTRCKVALLGADYHPSYFFWEAVVRLRTFAVIVAGSVATNVPRIAMLGMLLTVGLIFLCLHAIHLPFDNRSGQLLDRVEEHGLGIFCTMCAALLLGFADIMPDGVAFTMVFLVWLADVCYILHSLWLIWEQVRRSLADAHVEVQLARRQMQKDPSILAVGQRCQEKMFKWAFSKQTQVEEKRAKVKYDHRANALKLIPGEAGKPVQDAERLAFVQGLSDCISHAVIDAKVESLSVYFLEYIMRHAFSVYFVKQCDEGHLREALRSGSRKGSRKGTNQSSGGRSRLNSAESAAGENMAAAAAAAVAQAQQAEGPLFQEGEEQQEDSSPRPPADGRKRISFLEEEGGGGPGSEPGSPVPAQSMASRRRRSTVTKASALSVEGLMKVSKHWLFRADPYEDGMSLTDIQATLIKFLSFTKHSLENNYYQFMRKRGAKGEYKLKPRDRILHKVGLEKPKHVKKKESIELGAPLPVDPPSLIKAVSQAEPVQPVASSRGGLPSTGAHSEPQDLPGANPLSATEQEERPGSRPQPAALPSPQDASRAGEASMEAEDMPRETAELRMDRSRRALGDFEPPPDGKPRNSQSELMAAAMGFGPSSASNPATEAPLLVTRSGVAGPQMSETLR